MSQLVPPQASWQRALIVLSGTVVTVVVMGCLYWAQAIFIPVALAVYFSFLLSPVVNFLQRFRLGRVPSVFVVVILVFTALGGIGWYVAREVSALAKELPQYTTNISDKINSLKTTTKGSTLDAVQRFVHDLSRQLEDQSDVKSPGASDPLEGINSESQDASMKAVTAPAPVEKWAWRSWLPFVAKSLVETLAEFGFAVVLVGFMLLKREDLRNRLIRLVGHGRLNATTKALDEAGHRISRFLIMQAAINGSFGLVLAVGLYVLAVPYAFLWGFLAVLFRYLPYVGTWLAAFFPVTLSLAMSQGWLQPAFVIGLFLVIEIIFANVLEPRFFGHSMGVSEVALLIVATFWAFLWGPVGLFLSNPLLVCLAVLGKYVPRLEFFNILLGDGPALEANVSFYQRLLARDQDEASQIVQDRIKSSPADQVYDEILIPALNLAKSDRKRDELTERDEDFLFQAIGEIVEDLGDIQVVAQTNDQTALDNAAPPKRTFVLGFPARGEGDRLPLVMMKQLLDPKKWEIDVPGNEMLVAELIARALEKNPAVICISSLPPGGSAHARYLCKKLRAHIPHLKILVGRWGLDGDSELLKAPLQDAGADWVATNLLEARATFEEWFPVLTEAKSPRAAGALKKQEKELV